MSRSLLTIACSAALAFGLTACERNSSAPVSASAPQPVAATLQTQVYNPGAQGIFPVTSVLVTGPRDAVLVDAQFSTADAAKLVDMIKASSKYLTTIYISHGDPDYYFGLETLKAAFPDARIVATPQTVAHIEQTRAGKLAYWSKPLGAGAPKQTIVPDVLQGDHIDLDGQSLQIIGLDGATPDRTFVWIPSTRTALGGIPVMAGEHVWMADTQTPQSHADWLATLDRIAALKPQAVIPGHFAPGAPQNLEAVKFTGDYIRAYDEEAAKAKNSAELIAAMQKRYPNLAGEQSLQMSAKVSKGEMKWP
ncbi:MBL fold metallo-hydrolase [Solilutibacter silvestris]|uniref:MBL fold metallo-hydrolase n=1 Tax=Solilutibacter silvestris TaxID=1645665 RepID=UPI003D352574